MAKTPPAPDTAPDADAETNANAIDNGLSTPRPVDLNGDGTVDVVYAGDLKGNMWKFDVSNKVSTGNWDVAFSGKPLYIAKDEGGTRQPITSAPNVRTNKSVGGMMVAFGTGRNVGRTDPESVDVQTLYSVLDNTRYREVGTGAAKRLEVHPGGGSCPNGADCVPTPAALGAGVTTAKLAQQVVEELSSGELGGINRLHKGEVEQASFAVLKAPDIPSILVETAFISNPEEEARLNDEAYQDRMADAIVRGIRRYFARNPPMAKSKLARLD